MDGASTSSTKSTPNLEIEEVLQPIQLQLQRSQRPKYSINRLMHNGFMAIHHAYMVKTLEDEKLIIFEEMAQRREWV